MVRRPDVTIVDDPCLPPVAGNIERVAEMKFGADRRDRLQDEAYKRIAGDEQNYQVFRTGKPQQDDEHVCDCSDKGLRDAVKVLAPQPEEMTEKQRQQLRDLAKAGVALTGLAAPDFIPDFIPEPSADAPLGSAQYQERIPWPSPGMD